MSWCDSLVDDGMGVGKLRVDHDTRQPAVLFVVASASCAAGVVGEEPDAGKITERGPITLAVHASAGHHLVES